MGHKIGDKILARAKASPRREDVTDLVPEWHEDLAGARVYVRAMTGCERDAWETERTPTSLDGDGKVVRSINSRNVRGRGVQRTLVAENGERLFGDAEALGQAVDGVILDRLYEVFVRVSGLVPDGRASLKNAPGGAGSSSPPGSSAALPESSSTPATAPS